MGMTWDSHAPLMLRPDLPEFAIGYARRTETYRNQCSKKRSARLRIDSGFFHSFREFALSSMSTRRTRCFRLCPETDS
jgi:hypothetical protein